MGEEPEVLVGRRVETVDAIEHPGDYCGPVWGYTATYPAVFYLLPNAHDEGASEDQRRIHHVTAPPHRFRECADGSLEVRSSIGAFPYWHGFLDEGHRWRSV